MYIQDIPGRVTIIEDNSYLFFSGFAYLGMPSLPAFQDLWKKGISRYGTVFPSSRVSNTRHALYSDFENALSNYLGYPASASFSSGYLAAMAVVQFVAEKGEVYALKGAHPALQQVADIRYFTTVKEMNKVIKLSEKPITVVLESVNPLTGQVKDLSWLSEIKKPLRVLIDDSHGIGILGENGEGITSLLPQNKHLKYLMCYSLSKAFSCPGGGVSGSEKDLKEMKKSPPFTAASPMSPAAAFAWIESRELFEKQRLRLKDNLGYFKEKIRVVEGVDFDGRLPTCYFPDASLYERALNHHILLSAFRYPTPKDQLMTRAVLNALHTKEDLDRLAHLVVSR